jgi:hypothetical protein
MMMILMLRNRQEKRCGKARKIVQHADIVESRKGCCMLDLEAVGHPRLLTTSSHQSQKIVDREKIDLSDPV